MTLIVVVMALASVLVGEKVQAGGGLGWDGVIYGWLIRSMDDAIANGQLQVYHAQRILPIALIRAFLLLSGQSFTNAHIVRAFEIYNAALAIGATLLWRRIVDRLDLGIAARWVGFSALFVTFVFSKQNFFCPVLTDMTAYVAGLTMLLFSLEKKRTALLIVTLLAAFCWPTAALSGGALLLLLHTRGESLWNDADVRRLPPIIRHGAVIAIAAVVTAAFIVAAALTASGWACPALDSSLAFLIVKAPGVVQAKLAGVDACAGFGSLLTAIPTLLLFGAAVAWLAFAGLRVKEIAREARHIRVLDILAFVLALLLPWIGIRLLANLAIPPISNPVLLARLALFPTDGMIFLPLVSLGVFWGPMILLVMLRWCDVVIAARRLGIGVVVLLVLNIPFGVIGEPRFITLAWPFVVTAMVSALDVRAPSRRFGYAFALLSITFAQFWLPLNYIQWDREDFKNLLVLPKQLFFMHFGLWMGWPAYLLQGLALIVAGTWMWTTFPPSRRVADTR